MKKFLRCCLVHPWLALACALAPAAWAQPSADADETRMTTGTFRGLELRNLGPALMSGRISDLAIDPVKPNTWYAAAGSGNLWKTDNAGTTWTPIFENYSSYSIGCVTIDPNNRFTIWVMCGSIRSIVSAASILGLRRSSSLSPK